MGLFGIRAINEVIMKKAGQNPVELKDDEDNQQPENPAPTTDDNNTDTTNEPEQPEVTDPNDEDNTDYTTDPDEDPGDDNEDVTDYTNDPDNNEDDQETDYTTDPDEDPQDNPPMDNNTDEPEQPEVTDPNEEDDTDYTTDPDEDPGDDTEDATDYTNDPDDTGETGDEGADDNTGEDDIGGDDTNMDDTQQAGGSSELKTLEGDLFKDLSPEQLRLKNMELKQQYIEAYGTITASLVRLEKVYKTEESVKVVKFVSEKLSELKELISYYLKSTYDTKSYVENNIMYQKYLMVLNTVTEILDRLKING